MPTSTSATETNIKVDKKKTSKAPEVSTTLPGCDAASTKTVPDILQPGTSSSSSGTPSTTSGDSETTIIANETLQDPDDEASILRRRRLQKFAVPPTTN